MSADTKHRKNHLWQGTWIDDAEAGKLLTELPSIVRGELRTPLTARETINACDRLSRALSTSGDPNRTSLTAHLITNGLRPEEAERAIAHIAHFLRRDGLERKITGELGGTDPHSLVRTDFRAPVFEAWTPVGLLVHINAIDNPIVGVHTAVEGLLSGNVNVIKTSDGDSLFTHAVLRALAEQDPRGRLASRLIVLDFPSSRTDWMRLVCASADTVTVWGGEEAVAGAAAHVQPGCRLVEWGHRISFAYLTSDTWEDPTTVVRLADSICRLNQQTCTSPQVVYLDTHNRQELESFALRLASALDERGPEFPTAQPSLAERAEITTTVLMSQLEQHMGLTGVHQGADDEWRILVDTRSPLRASPQYRTVWVKPLPREEITAVLRPMRRYLQTVGLAAARTDTADLANALFTAGALRITSVGSMTDTYDGEPHDGLYPLQRYSRRVSVRLDERFAHDGRLDDLRATSHFGTRDTEGLDGPGSRQPTATAVMTKADVQRLNAEIAPDKAQIHFLSGGSSTGKPGLSIYTYQDLRLQLRRMGEGLVAAGLDVRTDRVANLFHAGNMYASFLYVHTLLEELKATQLPVCAGDYERDALAIVEHGADTVMGMPSYLWQLFHQAGHILREYGGVRKIFYGGEHFGAEQRAYLQQHFGVELVRSFTYGCTDLGALAHQCDHAEGTVHHLFDDLHTLDIVEIDSGRTVPRGETGRLVFTPHTRSAPNIVRYDQGDLGRWIDGDCACGRRTPRFELLGRTGDVVRIGTDFFNYRMFTRIAEEHMGYCGELQMFLETGAAREHMVLRMDRDAVDHADPASVFLAHYPVLRQDVTVERLLDFRVETIDRGAFERSAISGKLLTVIDRRIPG
ncbi:acyl-CoA reductase [Streptomyces sp. 4.24]|uniref:acyl-CoA reductase n=1 Tax=Streptomyces tritrimontium TaxID=3406573 RepID=UPI003BB5481C